MALKNSDYIGFLGEQERCKILDELRKDTILTIQNRLPEMLHDRVEARNGLYALYGVDFRKI